MKIRELLSYFRLFFIMPEVGNLDTCLGVTLVYFVAYFIVTDVGNLLLNVSIFYENFSIW
jgi:hypothetical protein